MALKKSVQISMVLYYDHCENNIKQFAALDGLFNGVSGGL